ncbi:DUF2306 domain-containing protein [Micromonospora echinospora]|uniref:DUF2306 domain-containing protein n=1 Tax=Micromonospora echinospora TaxID=1877 RepID=UPI0037B570BD
MAETGTTQTTPPTVPTPFGPDPGPRPGGRAPATGTGAGSTRRWWRRPWMAPLGVVLLVFVAFSLPPYLTLDEGQSRVTPPEGAPLYYPLLVAHVLFASVATLTCWFQVWPWFRRRFPAAHRRIGRAYVFAGVLPAGVIGFYLGAVTPFGPAAQASGVVLAPLWLICTVVGWRRARQRRFVEHRRWMIRSFALTVSIITNRIWGVVFFLLLYPQLESTFHGDEKLMSWMIAGATAWLGWTLPLLAAQWWLDRHPGPRPARAG